MNWLTEHIDIILTIIGGGSLTTLLNWVMFGKKAKVVEIKTSEVDYASKVSDLYEGLMSELKTEKEALKVDRDNLIEDFKKEKEYFRSQIDDVRAQANLMQKQFNDMTIAYSNEVQISQNWEKLHRELKDDFTALEIKYNTLEKAHDKLKGDFEKYKKEHKIIDKV